MIKDLIPGGLHALARARASYPALKTEALDSGAARITKSNVESR